MTAYDFTSGIEVMAEFEFHSKKENDVSECIAGARAQLYIFSFSFTISTPALTAIPLDFHSINNVMCNCWAARE